MCAYQSFPHESLFNLLKTTILIDAAAVRYTGLGPIPDWLTLDAPVPAEPEAPADGDESGQTEEP